MASASALPASRRLLAKLLLGTLGPTVVVLSVFGFWAHEESRGALEEALGRRLGEAAAGAALLVLPEQITAIKAGDEDSLTYARLRASAERARAALDVRRVAFVAADLTGRGDSDERIPLGAVAHELRVDAVEIERAAAGSAIASPLFLGSDGRPYKRAYAAIGGEAGKPLGFAVVEASADTLAPLGRLRRNILLTGGAGLGLIVLFGVMMARHLTGPLGRLAAAAEQIGAGDLHAAIAVESRDEVGQLAVSLEQMRLGLRTRDERLQLMLAGIAHEVRNPLGGLQLYAGLLRESLAGDDERLGDVGRIEREISYLEQVVTDFLDYARRARPHLAVEPLRPLLEEVVEVAGNRGAVTLVLQGDLQVMVDRAQLRRALINLVRNGLAAAGAGAGAQVVLAAQRSETNPDRVSIEVRDSGAGVPASLREKIFEPFFTTREKGTGLGLAFVREIVRDHGGEITVDAAPEGGARFTFAVPGA